jgi:hypothetical protein
MPVLKKIKAIAFYLPQFYPTPNNDKWWGTGFTEWTNVCKAKPLFKGHYQPHVPADLGFYDLRVPETREAQVQLAKKYGIDGFCYYHYWFEEGRRELELPFDEVLNSGKPDFPFMLCWANENWDRKFWNNDGSVDKKILAEQKYEGEKKYTAHFMHLLKAFKDPRYLKIGNKPMFMLYKPLDFPDVDKFVALWNKLATENGFDGIYFIGQTFVAQNSNRILLLGFDAVNVARLQNMQKKRTLLYRICRKMLITVKPSYVALDYGKNYHLLVGTEEKEKNIIPTLIPNFDHSPRSGKGGLIYTNSTPHYWGRHIEQVFETIIDKPDNNRIVFIKSWNEWGEGNHMEPDLRYGTGFLEVFGKLKDKFENNERKKQA